jgi:hypothetical protein
VLSEVRTSLACRSDTARKGQTLGSMRKCYKSTCCGYSATEVTGRSGTVQKSAVRDIGGVRNSWTQGETKYRNSDIQENISKEREQTRDEK